MASMRCSKWEDDVLRDEPELGSGTGDGFELGPFGLQLLLAWVYVASGNGTFWDPSRVVAQFQSPRGFRALYVTTTEFAPTQAFLELSADSAPHT